MRKLLLSLALLVAGAMSVWAQILADGIYTIQADENGKRGYLAATTDADRPVLTEITWDSYINNGVAVAEVLENSKNWYVTTKDGVTYLYNVAKGQFIYDNGTDNIFFGNPFALNFTQHNGYIHVGSGTGTRYLSMGCGTTAPNQVKWEKNNGNDGGCLLTFTPVENGTTTFAAQIAAAEEIIALPQDGKAYTIKAKYNDGTFRYIYDNGTKIQMTAEKPAGLSATFVCRVVDFAERKFAFVNNDGEYLVFYADGKQGAGSVATGLADRYELGNYDAEFTLVHAAGLTPTNGSFGEDKMLGCFAMQAYMNGSGMHYLMAGNPNFHNGESSVLYYSGGNRSSFFIFEEAEYANTPELKSVGTSELLSEDLHNKALATFSAPFATVVPEGVKAYTATAYEGGVSLTAIEGAIPANTGVVLERETAGTVTMKPVTSENVAVVTENAFGHSAGAAIADFNAGYVLSAVDGVAGFYKANGGTLAMNKAYLEISSDAQAIRVTRGSEEGTTGIENAEVKVQDAAIVFDLMGRRVETMIEGNIYIVNGKKIIR